MFDGERLRDLMARRGVSQSALARDIGVSQTTIAKLVGSRGYGSKYLHKIARALQTTPAYLERETDDPDVDAPAPPPAPRFQTVTLQVLLPEERALARMFEGMLRTMNPAASLDEQAQLLAKRLPIALSQLRDLLPASATPAPAEPAEALATPVPQSPR